MTRLAKERAREVLDAINGQKVLVFGDLMLDEYLFGEVNRISPEAPVPIIRVTWERWVLGGAANVASNLKAIGAEPLLVGTIGNDNAGGRVRELLLKLGVDDRGLVQGPSQPTIIKTRVIGQNQQMLRIDREEAGSPCPEVIEKLQDRLREMIQNASAVIVSDYAKGTVGQQVINTIRERSSARQIPWIVDPKPANKNLYFGASAMTPNIKELSELAAQSSKTDDETAAAASKLIA
ncbi:MAG: PfkB family carbohydrate kinase, partial [Holophagales bacterium]|nr:PfkB family carbohydrate kinase [Holophagales bacterium]